MASVDENPTGIVTIERISITSAITPLHILVIFREVLLAHWKAFSEENTLHRSISLACLVVERTTSNNVAKINARLTGYGCTLWGNKFDSVASTLRQLYRRGLLPGAEPPAYDYLDDLEALFYVFAHLCYRFVGPDTMLSNVSTDMVDEWADVCLYERIKSKLFQIQDKGPTKRDLSPLFRDPFQFLLQELAGIIWERYEHTLCEMPDFNNIPRTCFAPNVAPPAYSPLDVFQRVIGLFSRAIAKERIAWPGTLAQLVHDSEAATPGRLIVDLEPYEREIEEVKESATYRRTMAFLNHG